METCLILPDDGEARNAVCSSVVATMQAGQNATASITHSSTLMWLTTVGSIASIDGKKAMTTIPSSMFNLFVSSTLRISTAVAMQAGTTATATITHSSALSCVACAHAFKQTLRSASTKPLSQLAAMNCRSEGDCSSRWPKQRRHRGTLSSIGGYIKFQTRP